MHRILFITLIIGIALASCKKKVDDNVPTPLSPIYFSFVGQIGTNDNSTVLSNDDQLLICGNRGYDISILKVSKAGSLLWRKNHFVTGNSIASGLIENDHDDIFICGHTYRNHTNTKADILLLKFNSDGDSIWTKTYGGLDDDYGFNIIATKDSHLLLSCRTESFGAGANGDIFLLKLNFNGDTIWTKRFNNPGQEQPFHLLETKDGNILVSGVDHNNNKAEFYLLKVDLNGNKIWDARNGPGWKWAYSTIELINGDLISCGSITDNLGFSQVLIVKSDPGGNILWEKSFGIPNLSESGYSIKENLDGTYTIVGSSYNVNTTEDDIMLLKIDHNGNQMWLKTFGSTNTDWGMNLIKDINEDNIITGLYFENIVMTKTDNEGNFK